MDEGNTRTNARTRKGVEKTPDVRTGANQFPEIRTAATAATSPPVNVYLLTVALFRRLRKRFSITIYELKRNVEAKQ